MNNPIIITELIFSDQRGEMILKEEYHITFNSPDDVERFIQSRYIYWKDLLHKEMTISPRHNETIEEVEIQRIFKLTASEFGLSQSHIFRKTRIAPIIEARRFAIGICVDLGLSVSAIGKAAGLYHATIIHHRNKFFDLCDTEKGYEERYGKIKDAVLSQIKGRYSEDGSGTKIDKP